MRDRFKFIDDILNFIYPPLCQICGERLKKGEIVCNRCFDRIYFIGKRKCRICSKPLERETLCRKCGRNPPDFDSVIACGSYVEPLSDIIKLYKYRQRPGLSDRLARLLHSSYRSRGDYKKINTVTWVPMSGVEVRTRGFNQSRILAQKFADLNGMKVLNLLKKTRNITSQTKLEKDERVKNVRGAFARNRNSLPSAEKERGIILVDDVLTTGSTLNECAKALKDSGVKKVVGLVLAISP